MKKILIALLIVTNIISVTYIVLTNTQKNTLTPSPASANSANSSFNLPEDAVKISECIPFEGEHYVVPSALPPEGPLYSAYQGKVISIEFMFTPDKIPGEQAAKMSEKDMMEHIQKHNLSLADLVAGVRDLNFDMKGLNYEKLVINWNAPHSGLAAPHIDIHAYLKTDIAEADICPDAKLEHVYSNEVMQNIQRYSIPLVPASPTPAPKKK